MLDYRALFNQTKLSSADKINIQESYLATFDKPMRLKNTNCKNCYKDALIELINNDKSGVKTVMLFGQPYNIKIK